MALTHWKRKWYGRATLAVAAVSIAGLMLQNAGRAGAAPIPDVNNAGVFELDGDVTHEAPTTPPYDWTDLFTPVNTPVGAVPVSPAPAALVDSSFSADTNGTDVAFLTGSSKDGLDTTGWACTTKPVTPKDEIQNAYGAAFIAPSTSPVGVQGDVLVYLALERGTVTGTSNAGFWLFKQPIACDPTTGTFINPSTKAPAAHSDGDILLFASFTSGGTVASVSEFLWSSACTTTGQAGCISTSPTGGLTTANATGVDCAVNTTNLCGAFNGTSSITTPWAPGSVGTNGFLEVGMDLTKLIPPQQLAASCFSTFMADTRSSPSVTADLHDFITGSFSLCRPTTLTTTQTPTPPATLTVGSGTTSDTATLHGFIGSVSGEPANFTLFGPFTGPQTSFDCSATSTVPSVFKGSSTLTAGGTTSPAVSTGPLSVGTYYWVAYYGGDRASGGLNLPSQSGCTDEPVTVIKAPTTTKTTPSVGSGGTTTFGSSVTDHAVVTGQAVAGTPTGTVTFFVCDPTQTIGGACPAPAGTQVGTPVTATTVANSTPPASSADSSSITANKTGTWCFRAVYTPGGANGNSYLGSSDATTGECFTVTDTTGSTSAQDWLPNDAATVTAVHGAPLNGTLSAQLYTGDNCGATSGSAVTGQLYTKQLTNATSAADTTLITGNTTFKVTASASVSWLVTFTSTDPNVANSSHCEVTSLTITN
jgi:hypothetical protein